jgi:ribosomal protein S18 acetylase RimI-like enzyme
MSDTTVPSSPLCEILVVGAAHEMEPVRQLFREYQRSLDVDLGFQGFEQEVALLPGEYQAPYGGLLLARVNGEPAGCCALRPLPGSDYPNACEMKRLYVRPALRGLRLGRQLVERTLMLAQQAGFSTMLLDTLSDMEAARALYQDCGFVEIAPYYHNPLPGAHYLKAEL